MRTRWFWLAALLLGSPTGAVAGRPTATGSSFRLCVLDQATLIQRSRLARDMGVRFQKVRQQAQAKIAEDNRILDADARALDGLRSSIPPAVAKAKDADIAQRRQQLKAREDQINRNLQALDGELTANVMKLSTPMIRAVETEKGCSMLIGSASLLHLDDPSLDITSAVIDRINGAPGPGNAPSR